MQDAPLHDAIARAPRGGRAFWLKAADGLRLRIGHWPGPAAPRGTVFLLPGRTEYVEKYGPTAAAFAARSYGLLAIDWRGQGLADRLLDDPLKGHVGRFSDYQLDLAAVEQAAAALDLPRPWFLLAHSMGGTIGLRRLMSPHPYAAAAFSAPMWNINLPAPLRPIARRLAQILPARAYVPSTRATTYVFAESFAANQLTGDPAGWAFLIDQLAAVPGLALAGPTCGWLATALAECAALAPLASPALPALCALGTRETVVQPAAIHARMARWPGARLDLLPDARHEPMMEGAAIRARFHDACAALFDAARPPSDLPKYPRG